jgi:hypothetical protein
MTYRQIEASREIRLWITQVIIPTVVMTTAAVVTIPELREAVTTKFNDVKGKIKLKLHK